MLKGQMEPAYQKVCLGRSYRMVPKFATIRKMILLLLFSNSIAIYASPNVISSLDSNTEHENEVTVMSKKATIHVHVILDLITAISKPKKERNKPYRWSDNQENVSDCKNLYLAISDIDPTSQYHLGTQFQNVEQNDNAINLIFSSESKRQVDSLRAEISMQSEAVFFVTKQKQSQILLITLYKRKSVASSNFDHKFTKEIFSRRLVNVAAIRENEQSSESSEKPSVILIEIGGHSRMDNCFISNDLFYEEKENQRKSKEEQNNEIHFGDHDYSSDRSAFILFFLIVSFTTVSLTVNNLIFYRCHFNPPSTICRDHDIDSYCRSRYNHHLLEARHQILLQNDNSDIQASPYEMIHRNKSFASEISEPLVTFEEQRLEVDPTLSHAKSYKLSSPASNSTPSTLVPPPYLQRFIVDGFDQGERCESDACTGVRSSYCQNTLANKKDSISQNASKKMGRTSPKCVEQKRDEQDQHKSNDYMATLKPIANKNSQVLASSEVSKRCTQSLLSDNSSTYLSLLSKDKHLVVRNIQVDEHDAHITGNRFKTEENNQKKTTEAKNLLHQNNKYHKEKIGDETTDCVQDLANCKSQKFFQSYGIHEALSERKITDINPYQDPNLDQSSVSTNIDNLHNISSFETGSLRDSYQDGPTTKSTRTPEQMPKQLQNDMSAMINSKNKKPHLYRVTPRHDKSFSTRSKNNYDSNKTKVTEKDHSIINWTVGDKNSYSSIVLDCKGDGKDPSSKKSMKRNISKVKESKVSAKAKFQDSIHSERIHGHPEGRIKSRCVNKFPLTQQKKANCDQRVITVSPMNTTPLILQEIKSKAFCSQDEELKSRISPNKVPSTLYEKKSLNDTKELYGMEKSADDDNFNFENEPIFTKSVANTKDLTIESVLGNSLNNSMVKIKKRKILNGSGLLVDDDYSFITIDENPLKKDIHEKDRLIGTYICF